MVLDFHASKAAVYQARVLFAGIDLDFAGKRASIPMYDKVEHESIGAASCLWGSEGLLNQGTCRL